MRVMKGADGLYHVKGKTFSMLEGSRQQVGHGTAYRTSGNLTMEDLYKNPRGRWVSKKKSASAKKEKRLECHGFFTQKGKFGAVKKSPLKSRVCNKSRKNKSKKSKKEKV
jgi:hypothetical protein